VFFPLHLSVYFLARYDQTNNFRFHAARSLQTFQRLIRCTCEASSKLHLVTREIYSATSVADSAKRLRSVWRNSRLPRSARFNMTNVDATARCEESGTCACVKYYFALLVLLHDRIQTLANKSAGWAADIFTANTRCPEHRLARAERKTAGYKYIREDGAGRRSRLKFQPAWRGSMRSRKTRER